MIWGKWVCMAERVSRGHRQVCWLPVPSKALRAPRPLGLLSATKCADEFQDWFQDLCCMRASSRDFLTSI